MSEPGSPAGCQVTSTKRGPPAAIRSNLEMRLTAPSAVRGGKNSRENHLSPESILRLIFSRSLSCRSGSRLGVEHLELSLELSLPLLLPSDRGLGLPLPLASFTMAGFLLLRQIGGGEGATSLGLAKKAGRSCRLLRETGRAAGGSHIYETRRRPEVPPQHGRAQRSQGKPAKYCVM